MGKPICPIETFVMEQRESPEFPQPKQEPDGAYSKRSIALGGKSYPLWHLSHYNSEVQKLNNKRLIDFSTPGAKAGPSQ
jgi:hypothetical protein